MTTEITEPPQRTSSALHFGAAPPALGGFRRITSTTFGITAYLR
jgi:hypothetical protein